MLCFRCGSYNSDEVSVCTVCKQDFSAKSNRPRSTKKPTSSTSLFEVGSIVGGRYKIIEEIGSSIAGAVYRVYDQEIDTDIALKAIGPHLLQSDEERRTFTKQLKAARKLHHQNIVRIYDEGTEDDTRYFTMKLLEGLTLRKIIGLRHDKGQAFTTEELVPIFHQLAGALDYAHKTTFHGNLKPENVIILPDLLKITDFNLIKALPLKPFLGVAKRNKTYPYIAPELKVEAKNVDGRCDIYSLGVVLAEVLTGLLFEGHFSRQFSAALERLPSKLDTLIRKSLSEHPDSRYTKATHLAKDLEKSLASIASEGLPPPVQAGDPRPNNKLRPPPPEETQPGVTPEITDEGSSVEGSYEESLEELGPSQVLMIDSGDSSEEDWEEPTDRARLNIRRKYSAKTGPSLSSKERAGKAEKLNETIYSKDDQNQDLLPPPLTGVPDEDSYDSLPSGIAVKGETERPRYLDQDASSIEEDEEEEDEEDEETATDVLGIHEELTAVGVVDDSEEGYTMQPPPLADDSEEELGEFEDEDEAPPPLPRDEMLAQAQAPTLRPVAPPPPPSEKKSKTPIFIAAGVVIMLMVVGFVTLQVINRGKGDGGGEPAPKVAVLHDAGGIKAKEPEAAPEAKEPEAAPEAKEPEAAPEAKEQDDEPKNGVDDKAAKKAKKLKEERRAEKGRREQEKREAEDAARVAMEKREAAKNGMDAANALMAEQKRILEAADRRKKEGAAKAKRDEEIRKRNAKKEEEKRRRAEDDRRRKEEARKKAEAEAKLAAAKKGTNCPKGMILISAGAFKMGSSPSDPMRNFGEGSLRTVNVGNYCVDYYEFPNSSKRTPSTGVNWTQAFSACKRKGKRLCTEAEWEKACKGPTNRRFPYGNKYKPGKCNTDVDGEAGSLAAAKAFKKCRSKFGVYALAGNAEEWVSDSFRPGAPSKVAKGGAVNRPDWASRCAARRGLSKRSSKKTLGFRCCADAQ
ncbi:MAG: SUMF1/EgtB/PvdO family nonheme iron enzyme [Deltaproteobacteria bacterium]|nr:SUMF1/EgtB/PvdO family nonheme iron enzyme [Deltaproteobacteria bacterium]